MSETSRHRGGVEAGELLGGWQPESRIYTVVEKREIATADLIATDAASHRAHADGGSTSRTTFKRYVLILYCHSLSYRVDVFISNYFLDDFINQRKHP